MGISTTWNQANNPIILNTVASAVPGTGCGAVGGSGRRHDEEDVPLLGQSAGDSLGQRGRLSSGRLLQQ